MKAMLAGRYDAEVVGGVRHMALFDTPLCHEQRQAAVSFLAHLLLGCRRRLACFGPPGAYERLSVPTHVVFESASHVANRLGASSGAKAQRCHRSVIQDSRLAALAQTAAPALCDTAVLLRACRAIEGPAAC